MIFKRNCLASAVAAALVVASAPAFANGLAINEQSASAAGTAYAGRASTVRNASTIYGNPAGLSRLTRTQISAGAAFIHATTEISHSNGTMFGGVAPIPGTNKGDMVPDQAVPFLYFAQPLSDDVAWGLGIYVPFGVESDYENSFQGRLFGKHSLVNVITVQPTLSFKFNDVVSIGGGPTFSKITGKLTNAIPLPPAFPTQNLNVEVKGDDYATGYNVGLLFALTDDLDWGVTYHSKLHFGLDGHATISGGSASLAALNGRYDGSLAITMPESVDTSFTYRLNPSVSLYAGTTWTRWSRLESIHVKGLPAALASGATEQLNWEDTWAWALGAQYKVNDDVRLRIGYATDPSPTSNAYRTVRIPVSNRHTITLGAGWDITPDVTLDVAYAHIQESKGRVDQTKTTALGVYHYDAQLENKADAVSAQVTWRF